MIQSKRYDNSLSGGTAVMEMREGRESFLLPLKNVKVEGIISGPVGDLSTTHTFALAEGEMKGPVEAVYRFPLTGDAAVRSMTVRFGDTELETELKPLTEAGREYADALTSGRDAALLMRDGFDVYQLRISGLRPGNDISVTTRYIQMGDHDGAGFVFRFPLTIAPRYKEGNDRRAVAPSLLHHEGHTFNADIKVRFGTVSSPTHQLEVCDGSVRLSDGVAKADRDLVLRWSPVKEGTRSMVMVGKGRRKPFLALIAPDMESDELPRDVVILVDHSGSMTGPKWDAADWAVERFLSRLREDDTFNLCLFHSETIWLSPKPLQATRGNVEDAKRFLKDGSTGGTRLRMAIEEALAMPRAQGDVSRHLVTITDGQVLEAEETLLVINKEAKRKDSRRCSVVCIDSAPNDFLARQIARRSGGTVHFLTSKPDEGDITTALDGIMDTLSTPLATGLMLSSDRATSSSRKDGGEYLTPLPEMVADRVNIAIGLLSAGKGSPSFSIGGKELPIVEVEEVNAIHSAMRINELEILKSASVRPGIKYRTLIGLGFSHAALKRQLNEIGADDWHCMDDIIKRLIIEESMKNRVVSTETAMVVRSNSGEKVVASVQVPNHWPSGWEPPVRSDHQFFKTDHHQHIGLNGDQENGKLFNRLCMVENVRSEYVRTPWNLFQDRVACKGGLCVLFHGTFPGHGVHRYTRLNVHLVEDRPISGTLSLHIGHTGRTLISVDLQDLMRAGGSRPVNLIITPGEEVKLTISGQGLTGIQMEVTLS